MTDWNTIFRDLTTRANVGDNDAMNILHDYYYDEKDMLQEFDEEQVNFYKESANENKPYSLYQFAIMHLFGQGVSDDNDKAIELLTRSVDSGCSQGYYFMAIILLNIDYKYHMNYDQLLEKAMSLGNSNAYLIAGMDLKDTDEKQSIKYFKKSIELGNNNAIHQLAQLYHDTEKYTLAKKYYKQGCDKNNPHCYFNLGVMYREGEGYQKNVDKALQLFQKSMELGNVKATVCIGNIYSDRGDYNKAKTHYKKAVEQNDAFACYNLGLLYKEHYKHKKAIKMFIKGAQNNNFQSIMMLQSYGVSDLDMTDEEIDNLIETHRTFKNFSANDSFLF